VTTVSGRDLYEDRWWKARHMGIILRPWDELPAAIRRVWDERATDAA
jgi:predicted ABC-class ATPase